MRRKPTEHDAILYTGKNCADMARFLGEPPEIVALFDPCDCEGDQPWMIPTLHGAVEAEPGTWVVRGELDYWPVDAEQFDATYEVVHDEDGNEHARTIQ